MTLHDYEWHLDYIRLARDQNFSFEKTKYPLDKNRISLLDLDKVIEERDVGIIEHFLPSIIQHNIDYNEHLGILDQNFFKVFRISQLAVEYLLFCKKYLDKTIIELKEEMKDMKMENQELRAFNEELKQHTDTLLEKLKKKEEHYTCHHCSKAFSTQEYLSAHIQRRHNNNADERFGQDIEMEIKQIKEKLNNTEKLIKNEELNPKIEDTLNKNYNKVSELLLKFESLKSQVENDFKMLHTQKDFEEKYLKIFQSALENVKIQINKELGMHNSPYKFNEKRNSITQTDSDMINTHEKIVQVDELPVESVQIQKKEFEESNFQKLEDRMANACEMISKNMGSSLKNIEVQMQALWDKLQTLESKNKPDQKNLDDNINISSENLESKPKPKLRKRYSSKLQGTSTKTSEPSLTFTEDKPETDNLQRRSSDTRYDTLDFEKTADLPIGSDPKAVSVEKNSKPMVSTKNYDNDLDRIDVVDDLESPKTITVVKSINSLYETEEMESDKVSSSEEISEMEQSSNSVELQIPPYEGIGVDTVKSGSTLGKRSISSLRRASVSTEVVEKLKKEMEKVLAERLTVLGVSNEWKGIPEKTHSRLMDVLNHQSKLIQKSIPDYKKIKNELSMKIEEELRRKGSLTAIGKKKIKRTKVKGSSSLTATKNTNSSLRIRKYQSTPEVQIKNRKMYQSDSSSVEGAQNHDLKKFPPTLIHQTPHYSAVIEELKKNQQIDNENEEKPKLPVSNNFEKIDLQMKSVLKNFPTIGPVPKKRVLFDLKSQETEDQKPISRDAGGGSTTSVASSVLDLSEDSSQKIVDKKKTENELDIEDFSDSDFSILEATK